MLFRTLSSHTPCQFHSPGRLAPPGCCLGDVLRSVLDILMLREMSVEMDSPSFHVLDRAVIQACHAPLLAASSSGTESMTASVSKVIRRYCKTSIIWGLHGCEVVDSHSVVGDPVPLPLYVNLQHRITSSSSELYLR